MEWSWTAPGSPVGSDVTTISVVLTLLTVLWWADDVAPELDPWALRSSKRLR